MNEIWSLLIGYCFGNILTALVIGRLVLHKDPTAVGSGNPGTANMGAIFGKKWGIMTLMGDLLKSLLAFLLVIYLFKTRLAIAYCGLGLIIGHCFPILNHFKGGKGVAVAALWVVMLNWKVGLIVLLIALAILIITQNLTIAPLVFILLSSLYEFSQKNIAIGICVLIGFFIMTFKFRKDIAALLNGRAKRVDILISIKKKIGLKK